MTAFALPPETTRLPDPYRDELPLVNALPGLQTPACDAYIKRVVAVGGDSINSLPLVSPPDVTTVRLSPNTTDFPTATQGGVRAGVIFYSAPPGATLAFGDSSPHTT